VLVKPAMLEEKHREHEFASSLSVFASELVKTFLQKAQSAATT
jgi:hypothetical protein